jgi:hypothetical protein
LLQHLTDGEARRLGPIADQSVDFGFAQAAFGAGLVALRLTAPLLRHAADHCGANVAHPLTGWNVARSRSLLVHYVSPHH